MHQSAERFAQATRIFRRTRWFAVVILSLATAACGDSPAAPIEPEEPDVTTLPAVDITSSSGTIRATIDPNGSQTNWDFDIGTTTALGQSCMSNVPGTVPVGAEQQVECVISGLPAGFTVYYQVVADNDAGSSEGEILSFKTLSAPPIAQTMPATGVTVNRATLVGQVAPNGEVTSVWFEAGFTAELGIAFPPDVLPTVGDVYSVEMDVEISAEALTAGPVTVFYRVVAQSTAGRTNGETLQFTTLPP